MAGGVRCQQHGQADEDVPQVGEGIERVSQATGNQAEFLRPRAMPRVARSASLLSMPKRPSSQ